MICVYFTEFIQDQSVLIGTDPSLFKSRLKSHVWEGEGKQKAIKEQP